MAQQVQVILVDDLDGGPAQETVSFALDGASYEIDLNSDNAARLREELATWVGHARRIGGGRSSTRKSPGRSRPAAAGTGGGSRAQTATIREWARANGHKVSERGRISAGVLAAYQAANG
jgi:Lsr2